MNELVDQLDEPISVDDLFEGDDQLQELEKLVDIPDGEIVEPAPLEDLPEDLIDELGWFFHEINGQPLLSREDEFRLFVLIEAGRRLKEFLMKWETGNDQAKSINATLNIYEKTSEKWTVLLNLCSSARISSPNLGDIFSEIFTQRILEKPYHSTSLAEWFEILPVGEAIREQAGRLALEIPISLMLLPVQAITWISGYLARDERAFPPLSDFANWIIFADEIVYDTDKLLEISKQAHERMVLSNLRLVVWVAKKYQGRGIELADLVQTGSLGLLKAIEKFNPIRGNRFSTYATWWVRQAVTRYIADHSRLIRLPVHLNERAYQVLRIRDRLIQKLGRAPTPDEISLEDSSLTPKKVQNVLQVTREPLSLDMKYGKDEDSVFGDFLSDNSLNDLEDSIGLLSLQENIPKSLKYLSDREREFIELRFGLKDDIQHTLEEIGNMFNITRERVRQIETRALGLLRHPTRSRGLSDFLR